MQIEPLEGCILVQVDRGIPKPEKVQDTWQKGIVLKVNDKDTDQQKWIGNIVHWKKYKDDCYITKELLLIEIKEILGVSYTTPENSL
jgi:co-chaperonin GroES (HSP10)